MQLFTWGTIAALITWGSLFNFTGRLLELSKITLVPAVIGMTLYHFYEQLWNDINWGKYKE